METKNLSKILLLLLTILINCSIVYAQAILHPYNLNFEDSEKGKMPVGWILPGYAISLGYNAEATDLKPYNGKYCLELSFFGNYKEGVYGSVMQSIDATPFKGKKIRFKAAVKAEISSAKGSAHLWVREHLINDQDGMFDMMEDYPILFNDWQFYQIDFEVSEYADVINYGLLLRGSGKSWIDAASFEVIESSNSDIRPPKDLNDKELSNLLVFSKIFGYLRYYYPSSENTKMNWDNLAYTCIPIVENSKNNEELMNNLKEIFQPIAPLFDIYPTNIKETPKYVKPKEAIDNVFIAWKHSGLATNKKSNYVNSEIVNVFQPQRETQGIVTQIVNTEPLKGKQLVLSAYMKTDIRKPFGEPQLWVRIDKDGDKLLKNIYLPEGSAISSNWKLNTITFEVPQEASYLKLSLVLIGEGTVWFDNLSLTIKDDENSVNLLKNPDFEETELGNIFRTWKMKPESEDSYYNAIVVDNEFQNGKQCLKLNSDEETRIKFPRFDELFHKDFSNGLSIDFPLGLWIDSFKTLPHPSKVMTPELLDHINNVVYNKADRVSKIAIVINTWNILKQFSVKSIPDKDWDFYLTEAIKQASISKNSDEFLKVLQKLIAKTDDSQSRIWIREEKINYGLPILWKWIDDKLYITDVYNDEMNYLIGKTVEKIGNVLIKDTLESIEQYISSSSLEWKRLRSLAELKSGEKDSKVQLSINGKSKSDKKVIELTRNVQLNQLTEFRPNPFIELEKGLYYVDLTRVDDEYIKKRILTLKDSSDKIIFDLRGNTLSSVHILSLFTDVQPKTFNWIMGVYTRPDQINKSFKKMQNIITPKELLKGKKIAFLVDERTVGYGEAIAKIAKDNKLAEIIGTKTSGTIGEAFAFTLPADYNLSMTLIIANLDKNDKDINGVLPTITIKPNINKIIEDIDEPLKRAIEFMHK